ncbi:hypothetical protein GQ457_14G006850 [Hibiscus cannabinus]
MCSWRKWTVIFDSGFDEVIDDNNIMNFELKVLSGFLYVNGILGFLFCLKTNLWGLNLKGSWLHWNLGCGLNFEA